MKFKKLFIYKILPILAFVLFMNFTYAQKNISGKVIGPGGDGIPGVSVLIKGTTVGTMTDFSGKYSLTVKDDATILVFSYIGMATQEVTINGNIVNCELKFDETELSEVVVIGYGEVKKEDATGSVQSVSSDDFNKGNITSPQDLLTGKISGVVITSSGGQPGGGSTIRIRGGSSLNASNDPLIVIDGIPVDNSGIGGMADPLSTINPNDIESFTVLKDASATAIYGSRASNGVIIITTKRGYIGKMKISYNGNVSIGIPVKYIDVFNGNEYRNLIQEKVNEGIVSNVALSKLGDANTDWQSEIYQNAVSHEHNVSLAGSYKTLPYRLSLGYTDQNGLLKKSEMKRSTVDLTLTPELLDKSLKLFLNGKLALTDNNFSNTDAIGSAVSFDPTQAITNGNTAYGGYTAWIESSETDQLNGIPNNIATHNPVALLEFTDNKSKAQRYFGNARAEYTMPFMTELKAVVKGSYDYFNSEGHRYTDQKASWSYREPNTNIQDYTNMRNTKLFDFYINYNKEFGTVHKVDFTAGYSWEHHYYEGTYVQHKHEATDSEIKDGSKEYKNEYLLASIFGRLNYTLLDKYLFTATARYDGSSRFSPKNRFGFFPSFAFAWKINDENFLKDVSAVTNLKLRLGWGKTGQQDIGSLYPYIPAYVLSTPGAYYQFGNTFYPTLRPNPYDPNIKWEETITQNIGLDFGLLKDKVSGSIDVYKRVTNDLLNDIPIAAGTNFSNRLLTNVGSLENRGVEASLIYRPISNSEVSWEISGNFTYNVNEITKLTLVDDPAFTGYNVGGISGGVGNTVQVNQVGYPANTFLLFQQVYDENGMPIEGLYTDKTGNGGNVAGDELNKYYLEKPAPNFLIGLSSKLKYKQFDFAFSGRINIGNYVYNNNASNMALYQNLYNQSGYTSNILTDVNKTKFRTAQYWSDYYMENASFFRMDFMSVGYNFNNLIVDKISGRFSFTVQNAFVITKYTGLDPEVSGGIDNNIYPRPRTFLLGLNLNF